MTAITVVHVNNDVSVTYDNSDGCSRLILYCIIISFLEQQPVKICLDWCTTNEDIGENIYGFLFFLNMVEAGIKQTFHVMLAPRCR